MSYDFQVATAAQPLPSQLEAWAQGESGVRIAPSATRTGGGHEIERRRLFRWVHLAIVDEAVRAEADDLHPILRSGIRRPAWLTELHLPFGASDGDRAVALRLAVHLAKEGGGAVFDPQIERLAWPEKPVRSLKRELEQRIRLVTFEWFIPLARVPRDMPMALLGSFQELCSEALPRRYGQYEPPQERFEGNDASLKFTEFWNREAENEHGGAFFWTTTRPVLGGAVTFPDRREKFRPETARRMVVLRLSVNGTLLDEDIQWRNRATMAFRSLAVRFVAAYAHGYVERDVILRRAIWYGSGSEIYPNVRGPWFVGLPAQPRWLAWFGPEYRPLVESSIPAAAVERHGEGILVRWGDAPMDRSQLHDAGRLPPELTVGDVDGTQKPASLIPVF